MTVDGAGIVADEPNNVLQSYGDAVAGRSLFLYYAVAADTDYILVRDVGISNPNAVSLIVAGTVEVNFDVTINKPTIFSGIGYVDYKVTSTGNPNGSVTIKIYHVSTGAVETQLASGSSGTLNASKRGKMKFTVTRKSFGVGTKMRLEAVLTQANNFDTALYFEPEIAGNALKLWMPVVNLD